MHLIALLSLLACGGSSESPADEAPEPSRDAAASETLPAPQTPGGVTANPPAGSSALQPAIYAGRVKVKVKEGAQNYRFAITKRLDSLQTCIGAPDGQVADVWLTVEEGGAVSSAKVEGFGAEIDACVARELQTWSFDEPELSTGSVSVLLGFAGASP